MEFSWERVVSVKLAEGGCICGGCGGVWVYVREVAGIVTLWALLSPLKLDRRERR